MRDLSLPKVTFGIIVFNGEPFTRYCLRALYPFAHEIIVVEGACLAANSVATPDGHSSDGTLDTLYRFKSEEDSEDKVQIVVRQGFWSEKDEQSEAYAVRATGDYLWQMDIDEFYRPEDMLAVLEMVRVDAGITAVSFKQITFWACDLRCSIISLPNVIQHPWVTNSVAGRSSDSLARSSPVGCFIFLYPVTLFSTLI